MCSRRANPGTILLGLLIWPNYFYQWSCLFVILSFWVKNIYIFSQKWRFESWALSQSKKAEVFAHSLLNPFARTKWPFYTIFRVLRGAKEDWFTQGDIALTCFKSQLCSIPRPRGVKLFRNKKITQKAIRTKKSWYYWNLTGWLTRQCVFFTYFKKNSDIMTPSSVHKYVKLVDKEWFDEKQISSDQSTIYSATILLKNCRKVVLQTRIFFSGQPLFSNYKKGGFIL